MVFRDFSGPGGDDVDHGGFGRTDTLGLVRQFVVELGEVLLGVERGDRTRTGGRDGLAVGRVDDVTGGEDTRQVGLRRAALDSDRALGRDVDLAVDQVRARVVADRDEQAVQCELGLLTRHGVREGDALDRGVTRDAGDRLVPRELDLRVVHRAVLHDLRRTQRVLAVDDRHLVGEAGEERRLFHRGVATADDSDVLLAEEEAVAGRAPRDTVAGQALFVGETEVAVRRAGGVDDREGLVRLARADGDLLDLAGQVDGDGVVVQDLGTELLGLLLHLDHEVGALDPLGEAGEVLDLGRLGEFTARLDTGGDDERLELCARCVDAGGEPGRTGTDDDELAHA
ncbi:hypothetical protein BACI9J_570002 [Bacillus altitudinis]|nr:hypothetical protein BACI9J_570002 [Bacillus altitudinis]